MCAEGAYAAVARISWITDSGTGSGLKRRIERRVRKKLWRSITVQVEVDGPDAIDDASLSLAVGPGLVFVFEGKLVNVLISTLSCVFDYFTAHTKIAFLFIRVLPVISIAEMRELVHEQQERVEVRREAPAPLGGESA